MRNRDGLKLLDHASFTDDVEGQVARGRLRLGVHEDRVRDLLPHVEAALSAAGFAFEHSGLGAVASGQMAVMRLDGLLYRVGITGESRRRAPGMPPTLHLDSGWCGVDGARGDTFRCLDLDADTTTGHVHEAIADAAAAFRADARTHQGSN